VRLGLSFWAQALDNASPDLIELRGQVAAPSDEASRQEVARLVSTVISAGTRVYEEDGLQLTADRRSFVLEVPSAEQDRVGRSAPIVSHGELLQPIDDSYVAAVVVEVARFAAGIDRSIEISRRAEIGAAFESLKKKRSSTRKLHMVSFVSVVALALLLFSLGAFLGWRKS